MRPLPDPASEHVVDRFVERGSLNPKVEHDWLIGALGLEPYHIVRRHYNDRLIDFPRLQPAHILLGIQGGDSGH